MAGFGDIRLARRVEAVYERIVATGSVVLRRIGGGRAGELAAHRLLNNARVTHEAIVDTLAARTIEACAGRRVVAVQDTTEINFAGRDKARKGLGPAGGDKSVGFFIHPLIAVLLDEESLLGVVDAHIWTRPGQMPNRRRTPFAEKESSRWLKMAESAAERLRDAAQVIVTGDRESDIYSLFARRPGGVDLVVRACHNRRTPDGRRLEEAVAGLKAAGSMDVPVAAAPGRKARTARVVARAGGVRILRPQDTPDRDDPPEVSLTLIDLREECPPKGARAIHWRLLSTLPAGDMRQVREIAAIYRLRWRIEEVFRALKSQGLNLEATQVRDAARLFKLAGLGLAAAARIVQLVDARDGSPRPASDVADPALHDVIGQIGKTLEGATERQKNPHPHGSMAWLSWIAARLGGWNCYYKPPGPKTMAEGWKQLAAMTAGAIIALENKDV